MSPTESEAIRRDVQEFDCKRTDFFVSKVFVEDARTKAQVAETTCPVTKLQSTPSLANQPTH